MSKLVNGVMLGLVLFVVLLSVFWYIIEVRRDSSILVDEVGTRWGDVDGSHTEVLTRVQFRNPHRADAQVVSVEHEVVVGGERLDWDIARLDGEIPAGEAGAIQLESRFPTTFIGTWWPVHLANGESSQVVVRGLASFHVVQERPAVEFSRVFTVTTGLHASVEDIARNCGATDAPVCLNRTAIVHEVSGNSPFGLDLRFQNPGGSAVAMGNLSIALEFGGHLVAESEAVEASAVPPNGASVVTTRILFSADGLRAWWPEHVGACERSPIGVRVRFDAWDTDAAPDSGAPPVVTQVVWTFTGAELRTAFLCQP